MTGEPGPGATGTTGPFAEDPAQVSQLAGLEQLERDALLAWVGEHLPTVRRSAFGPRTLYWSLGIAFGVGLAAHIGGFLLKSWTPAEPLSLFADLLYTLGWALWTGVVVVVFLQVIPEAKKRGYREALNAYEAAMADRSQAGTCPTSNPADAGPATPPAAAG